MTKFGLDDVNGEVIGDILKRGKLFYDGRQQGRDFYAPNDAELIAKGAELKDKLLSSMPFIYPEKLWEIRIYE